MSKLEIVALGGLDESGKNLYVVDYNDKLFIFDCGLKYPVNALFGVDKVVPDITFLTQNKDRIAGIFITHAHEDHYGAVTQVLQKLDVTIYATPLAKAIINDTLQNDGVKFSNFNVVKPGSTVVVAGEQITFVQMTHSIPETCAISLDTNLGAVFFTSDFIFDVAAKGHYEMDFKAMQTIASKGVHTMLLSSRGIAHDGFANNGDAFKREVSNMFYGIKSRIIISAYATDLKRIQEIIDLTIEYKRKLFISGVRGQRLIDIALRLGYLHAPKGLIIGPGDIERLEKSLVVLVSGNSGLPFRSLQRMSQGKDKFVKILNRDTVLVGTPSVPGNEKMMAVSLDSVYDTGAKILPISKNVFTTSHAGKEDVKMLVKFLQPKYVMPVDGEYRHFIAVENTLKDLGYDSNQVLIRDNGEAITFIDGDIQKKLTKVKSDDVLIDGAVLGDVSDFVMRDRSQLSEDGIVTISLAVRRRESKLISKPKVTASGFVHEVKSKDFISSIEALVNEHVINYFSSNKSDWNVLKGEIREITSKYMYKQTKRKPVIITVILDA